jgi:hypothetical protein
MIDSIPLVGKPPGGRETFVDARGVSSSGFKENVTDGWRMATTRHGWDFFD